MDVHRRHIDHVVSDFAADVDNILSWEELRELGVSPGAIRRLIRDGWLHHVGRNAYLVGTRAITDRGRLRVALHTSGRTSALTCDATLFLAGVLPTAPSVVDIVVTSSVRAAPGVSIRRSASMRADDLAAWAPMRSVSVERALVDLSPDRNPLRLLKHMRRAKYQHRFDPARLHATIQRLKPRGTCDNVRRALLYFDRNDGGADSWLEERFHQLVLASGFPDPRSNIHVPGLRPAERADFVFETNGLIVEVDGPHHLDPEVRRDDARRDRALRARGWRVVRFWWWEIEEHPAHVMRRLGAALT